MTAGETTAGEMRMRDATVDDAEVVAEIYNASIVAGGACMLDEPVSAAEIRGWIEKFTEREVLMVLEADDDNAQAEILGWGIIKRYSDRSGYRFTCETAVYVRRDRLGRGLGPRIKQAIFTRCRSLGYHHLVAKIFAVNQASIEYNLKLGYEVVGTQKEIGFQDGQWQDVVILQKLLDRPLPQADD